MRRNSLARICSVVLCWTLVLTGLPLELTSRALAPLGITVPRAGVALAASSPSAPTFGFSGGSNGSSGIGFAQNYYSFEGKSGIGILELITFVMRTPSAAQGIASVTDESSGTAWTQIAYHREGQLMIGAYWHRVSDPDPWFRIDWSVPADSGNGTQVYFDVLLGSVSGTAGIAFDGSHSYGYAANATTLTQPDYTVPEPNERLLSIAGFYGPYPTTMGPPDGTNPLFTNVFGPDSGENSPFNPEIPAGYDNWAAPGGVGPIGARTLSVTAGGPATEAAVLVIGAHNVPEAGEQQPWTMGTYALGAYSTDPVNIANGNFTHEATDLAIPGRVLPFAFTRTYNSADSYVSPLGPGWTHSYLWELADNASTVTIRRGDGRRDLFTRNPDLSYASPPNVYDTLVRNGDATHTLTLKNQIQYEFSTAGVLTRIHEPAGNQILLTYTSGKLTAITDTGGRAITLSYDASNRLSQIQDPLGRKTTYSYDANQLTTVTDKIGNAPGQDPTMHRWQYAYTYSGSNITTITDPDGHIRVTNSYDDQGRVYEQRDGRSKLTTFDYSTPGQTTVTDPRGHQTTYAFDSRGRLLAQVDVVDGNTYSLSYTYDPTTGDRTSATDRNGQTTDFTYDTSGNVRTKTDPQVDPLIPRYVTDYQYDGKNNLTVLTDPRGFTTTNAYDSTTNVLLSVTRQIDASTSAVTKYEYTDSANPGLPTKIIAPRGNLTGTPDHAFATTLSYDTRGNLVTRIDPDGAKTTYGYDLVGRMTSYVDPDGYAVGAAAADHTWTISYDENDHEKSRTDPIGNALLYGYDRAGNRTSSTDRNGNVTTYTYDNNAALATVLQRPDPVGNPTLTYTTTVGRDDNGNATRVTQANGVVTDYGFDALNRMTSMTSHPDGSTNLVTTYVLDGNGNVLMKTTADGTVVTNTYDALNRLKSVSANGLATITYDYDASGNRVQMVDGTGTSAYEHDGLGRLTQATQPNGTLGYAYDRDGNRTTLTYPGTTGSVMYAYTPGGRLDHLTDWASRTSTYTYTASGLVSTLQYPNAMKAVYTYDRAQRLTAIADAVGTTTLNREVYALDAEGNRTALDEYVQGISPAPTSTWAASVRVNSDTGTTVQDHPHVAIAPDGSMYLVWDDLRDGNANIYFDRRDPSTGNWGATDVKVNHDSGSRIQLNPAVAVDGASSAYIVWQDERNGAGKPDIYYQKRTTAGGGTWLVNDVKVSDDPAGGGGAVQRNPRVAGKSDGDLTAVWVDLRSGQNNIYASTLTDGAGGWAMNLKVTSESTTVKDFPDVAVGPDGTSYTVWQDSRNGNPDIYFASLPPGVGQTWSANVKLSDDSGSAAQRLPRIGVDSAGNLIVVWLDDRTTPTTIRVSRRLAGTSTWSPSTVVTDTPARPVSVGLAVRTDGTAQIVFGDTRASSADIYRMEYDPWLRSWSPTSILVSDDPGAAVQQAPIVAYSSADVVAVWRDDRAGNANVQARRAALAGGSDHFAYSFDGLNRLTGATGPVAESFVIDAASNISSRTGPGATYTYDTSNRLTNDGSQALTWDNADRLTARGPDTLVPDALGRVTSSVTAGSTRSFAYSGDGLMQSATEGATTTFLWDSMWPTAALVKSGTDYVVHGLSPLYGVRADATIYTFAADGLGSVRAEVDATGSLVKSFRYRAYGALAASSGGAASLLGFAGELSDGNGFTYLRARWYDPQSARFISRDPFPGDAGHPGSLNGFSYAIGRPTLVTDPSGRCPPIAISICLGAVIGGFSGAAGAIAQGGTWQQVATATLVGAFSGGVAGMPGVGTRIVAGAAIGGASDLVGQLIANPNVGAVNWGSVAGAALGGGLSSWGGRNTLRIGEALGASTWTREWAAGLIGTGPSIGGPLIGGALWSSINKGLGAAGPLAYENAAPGTAGGSYQVR